jgi:Phage protein (N4 Gp49/phage Sf6 gene 66) family
MEPSISLNEAKAQVAEKKFPRVTEDGIKAKIDQVDYVRHEHLTICFIRMKNGFWAVGKAAPADPRNYSKEIGERYSYEDAFKQLWQLEGYALCEFLHGEGNGKV